MDQPFDVRPEHIQSTAAGMVAAHGTSAERICRAQIEKMRRRHDVAGQRVWENVLALIVAR